MNSSFEEWMENASYEELEEAYEEERQEWIKNGFSNGTGRHTPKMDALNNEMRRRSEEAWEKDPRRKPNHRWTDANRWERD